MKKTLLNNVVVGFLLTILIASCTTSQDVASNSWIQKRKYTKGFYIDKDSKGKTDATKAEETFTAQEVTPVQTESQVSVSTPVAVNEAVITEPQVPVIDNSVAAVNTPVKEKTKLKEKGLVGKIFTKAEENKERSREAFNSFKANDSAVVGAITPLGVNAPSELHKYLKKCLLFALIAILLYIIAMIVAVGSVSAGSAGGFGFAGVLYLIGAIFWLIALIFFIMWLIDILAN